MSETTWFRRGDGLEIEVRAGSAAEKLLARQAAHRIEGPGASADGESAPAAPAAPTKKELLARAAELGLEIPKKATNAEISAAIANAEAAASGDDSDESDDSDDESGDGE